MTTADPGTDASQATPGWMVAVLGMLLLPLAAGAFILSFEQAWPVMLLGGWSAATAWLGPVVLDITSAAGAVMHVVGRDRSVRGWGLTLLLGGTALSIMVNVAGHNIQTAGGARTQLPPEMAGWTLPEEWQPVNFFVSIAVPISVAMLVHAFGSVFKAWLATRSTSSAIDPIQSIACSNCSIEHEPAKPIELTRSTHDPSADQPESDRIDPTRSTRSDSIDPASADPIEPESTDRPDSIELTRPIRSDSIDPVDPPLADPIEPTPPRRSDQSDSTETIDPIEVLVLDAQRAIDSGRLDRQPSAEAIRTTLRIAPKRARLVRDRLRGDECTLRAV